MRPPPARVGVAFADIVTPALLVSMPVLEANEARMRAFLRGTGIALRPHAKYLWPRAEPEGTDWGELLARRLLHHEVHLTRSARYPWLSSSSDILAEGRWRGAESCARVKSARRRASADERYPLPLGSARRHIALRCATESASVFVGSCSESAVQSTLCAPARLAAKPAEPPTAGADDAGLGELSVRARAAASLARCVIVPDGALGAGVGSSSGRSGGGMPFFQPPVSIVYAG